MRYAIAFSMQIIRHPEHCPEDARSAVVALGNFDGVHLGHRAVIAQTKQIAVSKGAPCGVMTFVPHPREFFNPVAEPLSVYPLAVKERLLKELGVDILYLLHFDASLAAMPADDFIQELLVQQLAKIIRMDEQSLNQIIGLSKDLPHPTEKYKKNIFHSVLNQ